MRLIRAPVGPGFDASTYIPPAAAAQFAAAGYRFRIGYLRRDKHVNEAPDLSDGPLTWPVSFSRQELAEHLNAGLLVSLVQFARFNGRSYLGDESGRELGEAAAYNAESLGAPKGCTLWVDAEWDDAPPDSIVMVYLIAWGLAVYRAGYRPGIYEGYEGLTGEQWYSLPKYQAYWRSAMKHMAAPDPRGWNCYQGWEHSPKKASVGRPPIFGCSVDTNFACYDKKGSRFYCVSA